jgi:hypothetical protein
MVHKIRTHRVFVGFVSAATLLSACGSSSPTTTAAADSTPTSAAETTVATGTSSEVATTVAATDSTVASGAAATAAGSLKDVCPATIAIQTDWNPEAEHGFLYNLIGPDPQINADKKLVVGELVAAGVDTGVKLEVRSGGPAIGFQTVTSQLYQDDTLLAGFVYTDEAIQLSAKNPTKAVFSSFEKNPQAIMWDPSVYPDVKTIADLGKTKAKVRYFSGAAYMDYFTSQNILSKSQVDGNYDGSPALFVADQGKAASQIFGSAEPYIYQNEVKEWAKPVTYAYINDAGWKNYADPVAAKPEIVTKYADCFKKLVPILQQSTIDFFKDPAAANALVLELVKKYNNGWVYSQGVANYAVKTMSKDGLVANGTDGVFGSFDEARVADLITKATPIYTKLGSPPKAGIKPSDIYTNEFLDQSKKL